MEKITIIVPCKEIDSMTAQCIEECLKLDYTNFELFILPDECDKETLKRFKHKKVKIIETGKVRPSFKRNLGMKKSKAKFLAFIDSDAYPRKDWLKKTMGYLQNKKIGIVGGPNLTPKEGNFWERVSGHILSNFLVSGKADIRYRVSKNQYTHELPSCNYIARKQASSEYDPHFLTAEDSEFCFNCIKKGYNILYAGDVVVYHHRRETFKKHLKQMWVYGRDIAWLIKKDFSKKDFYYSLLSVFAVGFFIGLILSFFSPLIRIIFSIILFMYLAIIGLTSFHENIKTSFWVFTGSILTHFIYGFGFLYGILSKRKSDFSVR